MSLSFETLAAANKYTDDSMAGAGAVAGVPCQIQSITAITGGNRVTFLWVDNNGDSHTSTMDVLNGVQGDPGEKGDTGLGIKSMTINAKAHLIITYDNDSTEDAGEVPNVQADFAQSDSSAPDFIKNKPDMADYQTKELATPLTIGGQTQTAVEGALGGLNTAKADQVSNATNGNFAGLDANGNLTDSGKKTADFATAEGLANEVATRAKMGAKNLLKNMAQSNSSWHDVDFRVNPDGTITLNGTSSGWDFKTLNYVSGKKMIPTGTYILSGACENTTLKIYADNVAICQKDGPGEATFTITDEMSETYARMEMWSTKTYENAVMKPMIRLATDADDSYQPYAPTNAECLSMDGNSVLGATNIMKYPYLASSGTNGGIAITDNGDGTITLAEGTVSSSQSCTFWFERYATGMDAKPYRGKRIKFILDVSEALSYAQTVARIEFSVADSSETVLSGTAKHVPMNQLRNEFALTVPDNADHFTIMMWIAKNTVLPTFTLKPMITMVEYKGDYVPYAPTNRDLTDLLPNGVGRVSLYDWGNAPLWMNGVFQGKTLTEIISAMPDAERASRLLLGTGVNTTSVLAQDLLAKGLHDSGAGIGYLEITKITSYQNRAIVEYTFIDGSVVKKRLVSLRDGTWTTAQTIL